VERVPFGVTVVITRSSFRHLAEIARVSHASGAMAIHFATALPFGRAARDRARVIPATDMVAPYLSRAVAEARRLGMAVAIRDRAVTPDAAELFAGLGEVEEPRAEEAAVRKRVSLRVASDHDAAVPEPPGGPKEQA
jgi:hypothetical protein